MSTVSAAHDHAHGHNHHHGNDAPHISFASYKTGFILSVILTVIPFALVMGHVLSSAMATTVIILVFAVVQMLVHVYYFLHLDATSEGGWTMLAVVFTFVLVVVAVGGSIWVMYSMDMNMMPMPTTDMHHMP